MTLICCINLDPFFFCFICPFMWSFGECIKAAVHHWEYTSDVSHRRSAAYGII